jgi:hypothetical protein
MRQDQPSLHVTEKMKFSLPIEVEIETADSLVVGGQRVYAAGLFRSKQPIQREMYWHLAELRYRFYAGKDASTCKPLDPWELQRQFSNENMMLRRCAAGLTVKKTGRGKTASLVAVRPDENPNHSWALGPLGVAGNYVLSGSERGPKGVHPGLDKTEELLNRDCSGWRALIRDALILDYSEWKQLEKTHPTEWVRELFMPFPLTVESRGGAAIARVVCQSLLDVLIVTTQLDGIRGLRQRICKADKCEKLFPIGNYEGKVFCSYECAHRQAVREGRKRKAIKKASRKAKGVRTGRNK